VFYFILPPISGGGRGREELKPPHPNPPPEGEGIDGLMFLFYFPS